MRHLATSAAEPDRGPGTPADEAGPGASEGARAKAPGRPMLARLSALLTGLSLCGAALAGEAGVVVELNKLEEADGACRAFLVIENGVGAAFETLALDLVVFDADGVIAERLAVDLAPLAAGKTSVKAFDIAGLDCADAGRFLMNRVLDCRGTGGAEGACAGPITPRGRGGLEFVG